MMVELLLSVQELHEMFYDMAVLVEEQVALVPVLEHSSCMIPTTRIVYMYAQNLQYTPRHKQRFVFTHILFLGTSVFEVGYTYCVIIDQVSLCLQMVK